MSRLPRLTKEIIKNIFNKTNNRLIQQVALKRYERYFYFVCIYDIFYLYGVTYSLLYFKEI